MKVQEYADSSDLHHSQTTQNLLALLLAPINTYTNILTLFALQNYQELLRAQPYSTRKAIAHAVVGSVLKNDTIISTPEDVKAVLDLCHVLVKDQRDAGVGMPSGHPGMARGYSSAGGRQPQASQIDMEEAAEEQGWLARMVHLFKSDDLDQQFAVGGYEAFQLVLICACLSLTAITNSTQRIRRGRRQDTMDLPTSYHRFVTSRSAIQVPTTLPCRL